MAFMRMRSPNKAPPVLRLEGSTEMMATRLSSKSIKNLRTNSSTREDFPAPPVPVIPSTGTMAFSLAFLTFSRRGAARSGKFSNAEITRATCPVSLSESSFSTSKSPPSGKSQASTRWLIMPCSPMARPSSGE